MGDVVGQAVEVATEVLTSRALNSGATVIGRVLSRRQKLSPGGTLEQRMTAAGQFRTAVVNYRTVLGVLSGIRPRLLGAVFTIPLTMRQLRRLPSLAAKVTDATLGLCVVATEDVLASARQVLLALESVNGAYGNSEAQRLRVAELLRELDEAMSEFTATVRADCGHEPIREPALAPHVSGD